jgi:hypothetical protein
MGQGTNLTNADLPFSEAGIKTFGRVGRLSGNTATNAIALHYNMESQDCYQYVGKVVTLSFYYRTGTNFSGSALTTDINTGTGTDQAVRNGFTGSITQTTTHIVSSIWRRVSFTVTLSSLLNQIGLNIQYIPVGTAGANDYFDITGIQLELGSVPTSFEVRPFSVELHMCMRYTVLIQSSGARLLGFSNGSQASFHAFYQAATPLRAHPVASYTGTPVVTNFNQNLSTITSIGAVYWTTGSSIVQILFILNSTPGAFAGTVDGTMILITSEL